MNKKFDFLEIKWQIQEALWKEAGEFINGLKKLLFDKNNNVLYKELKERIEKEKQVTTA